jgi:hypothetical protein
MFERKFMPDAAWELRTQTMTMAIIGIEDFILNYRAAKCSL